MTAAKQEPPSTEPDMLMMSMSVSEYLNLKAARDEMTAALREIEVVVRNALAMAES